MAWTHLFKPPSGIPANGFSAGIGWGRPARGAGRGGPRRPFQPGNATRVSFHTGQGDPAKGEKRRAFIAEREARQEQMLDLLCDLALNAERVETQVSACIAALNRLAGPPVVQTANQTASGSLEKLIHATQTPKCVGRTRA